VTDRTVMLRIGANISGLQAQMRAAQAAVADFSKRSDAYVQRNSASIGDLSNKVGALGLSLVAFAGAGVSRFAQFDKAMSAVAATGDDARKRLGALREAAIEAGADTAFSAEEAANAIEELGKAGVSAEGILSGGLKGALALAAAGEIDVAQAAETAASAMTQFGLAGSDVGHIADLLAAGAGKAQGGVLDMGQALNQTGLIAGQVGLSIEETTGVLSAMASAGLIGSDAGTSLKTALVALSSPSKAAREEMEKYGISLYDANGNTLSLAAVAGQLQTAFADQSTETRNAALATIFGTDALRTANVLYTQGAKGITEWTNAVNDQGFAAEQAAARTDNLLGDIERLGGSLDSVFIKSGTGANDTLRTLTQSAEGLVDAIGEIPAPVLTATTMIAGAGGLALLGVAGLGKLVVAAADTRTAMKDLGITADRARGAVGRVGKVAAVAATSLVALEVAARAIEATAPDVSIGVGEMRSRLHDLSRAGADATAVFEGLNSTWVNFRGFDTDSSVVRGAESFQELLRQTADPGLIGGAQNQLAKLMGLFSSSDIGQFQERLGQVNDSLAQMASGGALEAAQDAFSGMTESFQLTDAQAAQLLESLPDFRDALVAQADAAGLATNDATLLKLALGEVTPAQQAAAAATEEAAGATEGAAESTAVYTDALTENIEAQREAAGVVLGLRAAENAYEAAVDDAKKSIEDNGKTLDVNTEKGRANRAALDDIAESGWDLIESMRANGASQTDLQLKMESTRERFIKVAQQMGLSKKEAKQLANELNLIPKNVKTDISADGSKARAEGKRTEEYIKGLYAEIQVAADTGTAYDQARAIQNYINGLNATITVRERHVSSGLPGSRQGGITRASGGPIPMVPGAVPGKDSVPVLAMPNEHMLTVKDVQAMGGHAGVYAFRAALHGGVQHMATGGAVGATERQVESLRARLRSARRLHSSDATLDRLQQQLDDALSRLDRLRSQASSLSTALRRGEVMDDVTSGLSGAYGVTDELRSLAATGDLGKARSQRLQSTAAKGERSLKSLHKDAERLEKTLAAARDRHEELVQVSRGVRTQITGAFALSDVRGDFDPVTGKRVVSASKAAAAAKAYAGKAKQFAGALDQLGKKSGSAAIVQEVAGYGVEEGLPLAQSLLADLPSLKSLAAAYTEIDSAGNLVGRAVARAVGGGQGVAEARAAVKQAEAQAAAIDKRIAKWGKVLGREMAGALGIKARAAGGSYGAGDLVLTGERGPELEFKSSPGYVLSTDATRRLAMATVSAGGYGVSNTNTSNLTVNNYAEPLTPARLVRAQKHQDLLRRRS
jgi:TP901 family phage tail tape measure protein